MLSSLSRDGIAACLGSRLLLLLFSGTVAETGLRMVGRRYTIQGGALFAFSMAIPFGAGASAFARRRRAPDRKRHRRHGQRSMAPRVDHQVDDGATRRSPRG